MNYTKTTNRIGSQIYEAAGQSRQAVAQHPGTSTTLAFGVGFGLGIILGATLADSATSRLHHKSSRAADLGEQILEAVSRVLPDALSSRLPG